MANHVPPPFQSLINCLSNCSPETESKTLTGLSVCLGAIFAGACITAGLGMGGQLPKKLELPLIILFVTLIVIFGIAMILISCCRQYLNSDQGNHPQLQRVLSIDSGLGSASSSLARSLDRSREDLPGSHDSDNEID